MESPVASDPRASVKKMIPSDSPTNRMITSVREATAPIPSPKVLIGSPTFNKDMELRKKYEALISKGNSHPENLAANLYELRKLILVEGLPPETEEEQTKFDTEGTLRGRIWKILLRVPNLDANKYISLVEKGSSQYYQKIRNDTFRTFPTNKNFQKRVPEDRLIRLLNAFVHSTAQSNSKLNYVQGMNVVCAPFLYVMPELDAFWTFTHFVKTCCPLYFNTGIEGAFAGLDLFEEILKIADPELSVHLDSKNMKAEVIGMPAVLSFSGCTPPLEELLRLWDFLFAFGIHINIVCVVAQIVLIRDDLLATEHPSKVLSGRTFPSLDANLIISVTVQLVRQLPEATYQRLVMHPTHSKKPRKYNTLPKNFKMDL